MPYLARLDFHLDLRFSRDCYWTEDSYSMRRGKRVKTPGLNLPTSSNKYQNDFQMDSVLKLHRITLMHIL